jgi:hypothetical protein
MTTIAIMIGAASCLMLLIASYLFGYSRGADGTREMEQTIRRLENDLAFVTERSSRHAPDDDARLASTIQQVLAPLVERERQSRDLAQIHMSAGHRRDLSPLLDRIASIGNFSTVLLANDDGLLLGSNFTKDDVDSMAAESSRIMLVADQSAREQGAKAL